MKLKRLLRPALAVLLSFGLIFGFLVIFTDQTKGSPVRSEADVLALLSKDNTTLSLDDLLLKLELQKVIASYPTNSPSEQVVLALNAYDQLPADTATRENLIAGMTSLDQAPSTVLEVVAEDNPPTQAPSEEDSASIAEESNSNVTTQEPQGEDNTTSNPSEEQDVTPPSSNTGSEDASGTPADNTTNVVASTPDQSNEGQGATPPTGNTGIENPSATPTDNVANVTVSTSDQNNTDQGTSAPAGNPNYEQAATPSTAPTSAAVTPDESNTQENHNNDDITTATVVSTETSTSEATTLPPLTEVTPESVRIPEQLLSVYDPAYLEAFQPSASFIPQEQRSRFTVSSGIDGLPSFITMEMIVGALKAQDEYGYPASVTIAQIIQEGGFGLYGPGGERGEGLSFLSYQYHNLFGIKGVGSAGSITMKTSEMTPDGVLYQIYDHFRVYNTVSEAISDRSKLIHDYYEDLVGRATNANAFAIQLGSRWATSIHYGLHLINQMQRYDLYRLDEMTLSDYRDLRGEGRFINPIPGADMTRGYGYDFVAKEFHNGLNYDSKQAHLPVYAAGNALVIAAPIDINKVPNNDTFVYEESSETTTAPNAEDSNTATSSTNDVSTQAYVQALISYFTEHNSLKMNPSYLEKELSKIDFANIKADEVVLLHEDGFVSTYKGFYASFVQVGDTVSRGQEIGLSIAPEDVSGALEEPFYFQIDLHGIAVNPLPYYHSKGARSFLTFNQQ